METRTPLFGVRSVRTSSSLLLLLTLLLTLTPGCSSGDKEPMEVETATWTVIVPLGLSPDLQEPADNPTTREKVELGRFLYYDPRLSVAGDVSCATCHHPEKGFTDNLAVSTGHEEQQGGRSAPPVTNATYSYLQFWDGRAATLEEQALGPVENPLEMGNTVEGMTASLEGISGYGPLFEAAFGDPEITPDRVAKAIAAFERTVLSGNSKWDRYMNGDETAMSESEARGWELFKGKAQCTLCHAGQTFSDSDFHNIGVGMDEVEADLGRHVVTADDVDRGAFKTPMLRDVSMTAPYMHDGSQVTLEEVVEFYDQGGHPNDWLDPKIVPLNLTDQEKADLVAFMRALDGEIPNDVGEPAELP